MAITVHLAEPSDAPGIAAVLEVIASGRIHSAIDRALERRCRGFLVGIDWLAPEPEQGLRLIDALLAREELASYHLAHTARADFAAGWDGLRRRVMRMRRRWRWFGASRGVGSSQGG